MKIRNCFIITISILLLGIISACEAPLEISIFSGDRYNGEVIVKNTASTPGSFILSISCNNSNVDGIGSELFFEAGEEAGISFSIFGTNTNKQNLIAECTYTVTDRKSGISDSDNGLVIVRYQGNIVCEPSSIRCIDATILRTCSEDGTTYEDTKCKNGCQILQDGRGICKIVERNGGGNTFLYIIIFILFVIILLAIIFKTKKKK